jgi:hypothetical protein
MSRAAQFAVGDDAAMFTGSMVSVDGGAALKCRSSFQQLESAHTRPRAPIDL